MPRYFFDTRLTGSLTIDEIGTEYDDLHDARSRAENMLEDGDASQPIEVVVRDELGRLVLTATKAFGVRWA